MCNCNCKECNERSLMDYLDKQKENERFNKLDMEIVANNIPIILDLVKRYYDILSKDVDTSYDAERKQRLAEELAYKIVKYCR